VKRIRERAEAEALVESQRSPEERERRKEQEEERFRRRQAGEKSQRISGFTHPLAADLGKRYSPERAALDKYLVYHEAQKECMDSVRKFLGGFRERIEHGENLIFFGVVGTGKDHLLASCLYLAAREEIPCRWANGQDLFGNVRDRIDSGESENEWFKSWTAPTVLGISDPVPPVGELSSWRTELLYRLIDRRYRSMRSTWVTLNVRTREEADQKLSQQVFDRLQEGATIIPCFWPSFRERKPKS
jgi:DNA replication protein DnaC